MTDTDTNKQPITQIDENTLFRGAIYFYSKGTNRDVSLDFDFSHEFADDYDGPVPAALKCLRDVGMSLQASADRLDELVDLDADEMESLSAEERAERVLEAYSTVPDSDDTGVRH